MHHCRKRLSSRIHNQLACNPIIIHSLQDLMDVTLKLDTRYHERQKEKNNFKEKNTEDSKSSPSHTKNSSSSSLKKKNFRVQKMDKPHSFFLNRDHKLMSSGKEIIFMEGLCAYCGGKHSIEACVKRPQNHFIQPEGRFPSHGKA
ncbi:hypothetical protein O181_065241 [Austropuccinia psidii MF-1]|uniref:Uncharacterized protein n=1 Tax=Austropuccinia psidii MF-1 TaxID=1389203 RepID=A0A9Q3ENJ8_9BASI|nr:hypothetical protein [Austropuccinia psidii MF-1]